MLYLHDILFVCLLAGVEMKNDTLVPRSTNDESPPKQSPENSTETSNAAVPPGERRPGPGGIQQNGPRKSDTVYDL